MVDGETGKEKKPARGHKYDFKQVHGPTLLVNGTVLHGTDLYKMREKYVKYRKEVE